MIHSQPSGRSAPQSAFAPSSASAPQSASAWRRRVVRGAAALGFSVAAVLAAPPAAQAMTVLAASLQELVGTSAIVLHAKVRNVRVDDRRAAGRAVWTVYELDVVEVLKGDRKAIGPRFTFELLGGSTKDGMTLSVPGMPGFVVGEEAVVLLERHSDGYTLTGAPQGKWTVYRDAKGIARVIRPLEGAHMVRRTQDGRLAAVEHDEGPLVLQPPQQDQTLAALRAEILDAVQKTAHAQARVAPVPAHVAPRVMQRAPVGSRKP
jgi:hypothetical protein